MWKTGVSTETLDGDTMPIELQFDLVNLIKSWERHDNMQKFRILSKILGADEKGK
jgi:hypothetical protein